MARYAALALAGLLMSAGGSAAAPDPLLAGFHTPPLSAKPRVWWHWMNGNVTKAGIAKDLAWMHHVGIGGVDAIDASIETPQVVPHRLVYMTPEWQDAFRYAAGLTDKYGMELSIDSSPGWSETGGPWVTPQAAMKKLVWSATPVQGPFHGMLPRPPAVPGPLQNIRKAAADVPDFYRDSVVLAYRDPVAMPAAPNAASSEGAVDAAVLRDGDLTGGVTLTPADPGKEVWIRIGYDRPVRMQGLTLALTTNDDLGFAARIEASDDGTAWRLVADIPKAAQVRRFALPQQTIAFAPVTARFFRVAVRPDAPIPNSLRIVDYAPGAIRPAPAAISAAPRFYHFAELVFHTAATINEFEKKAGFAIARDNYAIATTAQAAPGTAIDPATVIDITSHMAADGTLDWTPPPGRWTVLRLGYSLTGAENHPATQEATGLEVDKLNAQHVGDYLQSYLDTYKKAAGPALFAKRGLTALLVDSTEVGAQNWTETILADFRRLRGYDPTPWLPALTGVAVNSTGDSDKFLWDWRRTINQLLADNHYGQIARTAKANGLLQYGEALEDHRPTFGDDIEMRRFTDVPMGAMWAYGAAPRATYVADLLGAASVAHVYGREFVAAESLTSAGQPWALAPRDLKPVIDLEFALGVNRVFLHTSVHQPVDRPPGLSLGGYGQFFNRLESWADLAGGWMTYIARCSWLLQQGRYAADIAYFTGEEAPLTGLFGDDAVHDVPPGYGFDFVGSDALLHQLSVDHGDLVTPSGMRYRLLYLGGSSRLMTQATLRRIAALVQQGAAVVGQKPEGSPSLADDPAQFQTLADKLFGTPGQGRVFADGSLKDALAALKLAPDFDYSRPQGDTELLAIHRHLQDGELYFVTNRRDRAATVDASFRVAGLPAQILDPVTGEVSKAAVTVRNGISTVSLALAPHGSAFVVFRRQAGGQARPANRVIARLDAPWHIAFQPGRGAPPSRTMPSLQSWSDNPEPGIRYFSGTADYTTDFTLPAARPGTRLTLDLGAVHDVAGVWVNGRNIGTAWTAPFALDVTHALRPGRNKLLIRVANLWVNRLIGDARSTAAPKHAFTTIPTYAADAPLRVSGLLGPVTILQAGP